MSEGIEAVRPGGTHEHCLSELLQSHTAEKAKDEKSLYRRLLESAASYLKAAGIMIPYATLEVRDTEVVMHGAPNCGEVLVCAFEGQGVEGPGIQNYL